jgi:hypothetical protein
VIRGLNSPWRRPGPAKGGRPVPTLAAGPSETATRVYTVLAQSAPAQQGHRLPEVVMPVGELAGRAACSPRTAKRALRVLRVAGWVTTARLEAPGRRGGRLQGRLRVALVMPPDAVAADVRAGRNAGPRIGRQGGEAWS